MAEILHSEQEESNFFKRTWSTIQAINKSKAFNIIGIVAIFSALPLTVFVTQQNQDVRNRAQEQTVIPSINTPSVPDEILVKFTPGASADAKQKIQNEHALEVLETIPKIDVLRVRVNEQSKDKVLEALTHNPNVQFAEPNYLLKELAIPNDPWYIDAPQWNLAMIGAPLAWDTTKGSTSVVVAVIDSGLNAAHEDFAGKVVPGYNFIDNNTDTNDVTGHGTIVSGFIGAVTNNNKGIASLGWNTPIMPLRFRTTEGAGSVFNMARALLYAADNGAKVVNISNGYYGSGPGSTMQEALNYAWNNGLVITAASGNDGKCCVQYPAAAENVIGVGAVNGGDVWANFSSFGEGLDVVAPGQGVYATDRNGSYGLVSGTSYASPHVAALAALLFSANPQLTNVQVMNIINTTALDKGTLGWDDQTGWGRIQADKAVQKAFTTPQPADAIKPTIAITSPMSSSEYLSGILTVTVAATDNVAVSKVEYFLGRQKIATSTQAPFTVTWDSTTVPDQFYSSLFAVAYDAQGNFTVSSVATIHISNGIVASPTSSIATPTVFVPTNTPTFTPTPIQSGPTSTSTPGASSIIFSNINPTNITQVSATINWTTNVASTTRVEYGTSQKSLSQTTVENATQVTNHAVALTGLKKNANYYYRVVSKYNGVEVKSAVQQFKTAR
jgi:thermitase